jgi:FixJ family two-component response regulator
MSKEKILLVTSDMALSECFTATLKEEYDIARYDNAEEGLAHLGRKKDVAVVVTGLTLPGMGGLEFLEQVKKRHPKVVCIIITGEGNFDIALDAVNRDGVYKFLKKPCSPDLLSSSIKSAVERYHILLEDTNIYRQTLQGLVKMLVEILGYSNPAAVGRSTRARPLALQIGRALGMKPLWILDISVMLSQIGCVGLPRPILTKIEKEQDLEKHELKTFMTHPSIAAQLLQNIPKMEKVAEIVRLQNAPIQSEPPLASRIIKVCLDMDRFERRGAPPAKCIELMRKYSERYDAQVVNALADILAERDKNVCLYLSVGELQPGMIMAADITTRSGAKIFLSGQRLSQASHLRLQAFADLLQVEEPLCVMPSQE